MTAPDDPDLWLTPPQVARMWNVKLSTVRNWIRRDRVTVRADGKVHGQSVYDYLDTRGDIGQHTGARQLGVVARN